MLKIVSAGASEETHAESERSVSWTLFSIHCHRVLVYASIASLADNIVTEGALVFLS